jgi:hypothetical protein
MSKAINTANSFYFPAAGKQAFPQGVGLILSKRGKQMDGIIHLGFKKNIDQSLLYQDYNYI